MNRVWTALLLLATVFVAGAVVYVLGHNDKVADAGSIPSLTVSPSTSGVGQASSSGSASTSGSSTPSGPKTVVFLGDDWAAGVEASSPSRRFANLLGAELHLRVEVVAAPGGGYAKPNPAGVTYLKLVDRVVSYKPYMVVVSGGRNDVTDDITTLKNDAKALFTTLRSDLPETRIVAVAPFWGDSDAPPALKDVADAVKSGVSGDVHGTYLDIPDPIHGNESFMGSNQADPNDAGNAAIAAALRSDIQTYLTEPIPTSAPTPSSNSNNNNGGSKKGSSKKSGH